MKYRLFFDTDGWGWGLIVDESPQSYHIFSYDEDEECFEEYTDELFKSDTSNAFRIFDNQFTTDEASAFMISLI